MAIAPSNAGTPAPTHAPTVLPSPASQKTITWRSLLLALVGIGFVCGLAPYNDFVVANTYLIGNFLPIGLLVFFLAFLTSCNALLLRFLPRRAVRSGELTAALAMVLVGCAVPSSGLMRYLPAQLIAPWYHAGASCEYAKLLDGLGLPQWVFPGFESAAAGGARCRSGGAGPCLADACRRRRGPS